MHEKTTRRMPSAVNETSQSPMASVVGEKKRKVTVIAEEHEPDELQAEMASSSLFIDPDKDLLPAEKIKEFFDATEDGSIERLDDLFDRTPHSDPNMTQFTESLLMAAIRAKQQKVAEYLIDQLAINADHKVELLEFNTSAKIPIGERIVSSRDLAYDEGMMDLVDLIDIVSNEIKPSTKRFLQRRIQTCLAELHQAHLTRLKERQIHLARRVKEKEAEEVPAVDEAINTELLSSTPPPPPTPPPPTVNRSCKSYIEETLQSIQSSNAKSIDETGRKHFRFSGYTVRYRVVDTIVPNKQIKTQTRSKKTRTSFPTIPVTTPSLSSLSFTKSRTLTDTPNLTSGSLSEVGTQIPIRENRTSICRSALHQATPRPTSRLKTESLPEVKPSLRTRTNTPRHALLRRTPSIRTSFDYVPQPQPTMYREPCHFIPLTLKSTAAGLPSDKLLFRD